MSAPSDDAADLAYRADPSNWATNREAFRKGWKAGVEAAARVCDKEAARLRAQETMDPSHEGVAYDCAEAIRATGGA